MATHQITVTANYESEGGGFVTFGVLGNFNDVVRGDRITIINSSSSNRSITVSGFDTQRYNSASSMPIGIGSSAYRDILVNATLGNDVLSITTSSGGNRTVTVKIADLADTYPDSFSFGSVANAYPSESYINRLDWTGTNTAVTVQAVSNCQVSPNGVNWYSSFSGGGSTGGRVYVKVVASSGFSQTVTGTVSIGGRTNTSGFQVTTFASYPAPKIIPLGITGGTIWLSDIQSFFGFSTWITDYRKGGALVPDVSPNNDNIPTSGEINITDFYNSATSLYWLTGPPKPKYKVVLSTGSNQTISLDWYGGAGQEFDVGFGSGIFSACEKRYTISYTNGFADFTSQSGNPTAFSLTNNWVKVAKTATAYEVAGTITVYIKHPKDTSGTNILQHTFDFELIIAS